MVEGRTARQDNASIFMAAGRLTHYLPAVVQVTGESGTWRNEEI
jgi:hypothetical protein